MLRGASFVVNDAAKLFLHLSAFMDIAMYEWYIDDVDLNYIFFREGQYSGAEFKAALNDLSALSFARIRQYPANASVHSIDKYEDYAESECESLILFYDGGFFEFYSKDVDRLHAVFKFGSENGFDRIKYIDNSTDARS